MTQRYYAFKDERQSLLEHTAVRTFVKVLIALALIGLYWAFGGFDPVNERYLRKLHGAFFAVYFAGVICALCEGDPEHIPYRGYSMRPIFVIVGVVLMIIGFSAMLATKGDRHKRVNSPNQSMNFSVFSVIQQCFWFSPQPDYAASSGWSRCHTLPETRGARAVLIIA